MNAKTWRGCSYESAAWASAAPVEEQHNTVAPTLRGSLWNPNTCAAPTKERESTCHTHAHGAHRISYPVTHMKEPLEANTVHGLLDRACFAKYSQVHFSTAMSARLGHTAYVQSQPCHRRGLKNKVPHVLTVWLLTQHPTYCPGVNTTGLLAFIMSTATAS